MMKNAFGSMLLREWRIKRQGAVQWLFPLMIFLIIITLFPLAVGSESALLLRLATSAVWIAALLSLVMGVDDLFKADMENGTFAQMVVSGSPLSVWVFARLLVHWLFSAGFLAFLSLLANPLFNMPFDETLMLMLSIIVGSPLMLMLSAIASSLVLSLKNGAVMVPLIALPMQLPVLIFATGAVDLYATGLNGLPTLALLGAMSIIAVIVTPWVVAQILKIAWSS
ncbi:ABC transporter permease [Moraxella ovis]|uniref:Heme exporter protein B n=1 Tax=Moraxella ovis TaxID=29433 RepID=A0A378PII1_9GAMM|nr:heme exporter protein CcmB [Moraxella ovis]ANB91083.1 ABC transporter permease [Moraxella ovis]STY86591.1 Cytochrome c-type biogenesis protein CcmB [Moraxella ovis]